MIQVIKDTELIEVQAEYIVNPANSIGWMGGVIARHFLSRGVAEYIHYHSKGLVEKESKRICFPKVKRTGDLFVTDAYGLPFKGVIHLVTVPFPGIFSSEKIIEKCLINLVSYCKDNEVQSVVLTGLGTGVGRVRVEKVASLMNKWLKSTDTKFIIADKNLHFLNLIED